MGEHAEEMTNELMFAQDRYSIEPEPPIVLYHTTKDGYKIRFEDLTDNHLRNIIALKKRNAKKGITVVEGGGSSAEEMWGDVDVLYGLDALIHNLCTAYLIEWVRRFPNDTEAKELITKIENHLDCF